MFARLAPSSVLVLSLAAACSGNSSDDQGNPDAAGGGGPTIDAAGGGNVVDAAIPTPDATVISLPDARPSALACAGDPLPTVIASPPVVISGDLQKASNSGAITPLGQSAKVSAHNLSDDVLIVDGGDFANSTFTITGPNDPAPIAAYLKATSNGFIDTYVFPPTTIFEDQDNTPVIFVTPLLFNTLLPVIAATPQDPGNGAMIVAATDCEQQPMEGAVLSITPNAGTIHYANATGLPGQQGDFAATQTTGVTYFLNLPPGAYTVNATAPDGTNLRSVPVKIFADSSSTAIIAP